MSDGGGGGGKGIPVPGRDLKSSAVRVARALHPKVGLVQVMPEAPDQHTHTHTYIYIYIYIYTDMYIYICVYTYIE